MFKLYVVGLSHENRQDVVGVFFLKKNVIKIAKTDPNMFIGPVVLGKIYKDYTSWPNAFYPADEE